MTTTVYNLIGVEVAQLPEPGIADRIKPRLVHSAAATDQELMAALRTGDHTAFAELANRYFAQAYRVAWRVLGGPADAEDLAQEAFIKLWQAPHSLRDGAAVRSWLMRVVTNLAIDRKRRKQLQTFDSVPDIAEERPTPEDDLSRDQVANEVDAAISRLPDRQRVALVLTYFEGMTNQQTAQIMDLSVDAVESLLSRARRNLKSQLAERWRYMLDELARQ